MMTTRIPTGSRRQAMDWSLVLVSQGIETVIDSDGESGWGLIVPEQEYGRALEVLRQYRAENRHWPWRQKISPKGILFDWGSVGWVLLIGFFYWIQTHAGAGFRNAGLMDAIAVSHGEWWRLFTAIFLHADLGHLAMNASIGLLLLGLVMGNFGTGVGLLAAYLAGAGGNVATLLIFSSGHRSLGASGMVMGCVGLLAAQTVSFRPENSQRLKYILSSLVGGVMLFALLGLSPESDVLAHLGGFVSGLMLGSILANVKSRPMRNTTANVLAGIIFGLLVVLPWWSASSASATR
ncbi:MAG TPA: rhomboid family intramembrane serine protease [Verrucomicrobiae bacterium]|nr:rhomboid family intramembrane serine protease [Verrucomicrobiae bacterium]